MFSRRKKLATVSGRAGEPCPDVLFFSCCNLVGPVLLFYCFLGVFFTPLVLLVCSLMLSCCPFGAVRSRLVLLPSWCVRCVFLPSSFVPHVLLWSFCCPAAIALFTLLSEARAGAAAAHHRNNNSCRLSCLGSMLSMRV